MVPALSFTVFSIYVRIEYTASDDFGPFVRALRTRGRGEVIAETPAGKKVLFAKGADSVAEQVLTWPLKDEDQKVPDGSEDWAQSPLGSSRLLSRKGKRTYSRHWLTKPP